MQKLHPIVLVFAIVGAIVLLGIVLQVALSLIWLAIVVGIVVVGYYFIRGVMGKRS